jgi:hypothetical protein
MQVPHWSGCLAWALPMPRGEGKGVGELCDGCRTAAQQFLEAFSNHWDLRWEWRIADPDDGLQLSVTVVTVSIGTRRLLKK